MKFHALRGVRHEASGLRFVILLSLATFAAGCGRADLGFVRGQVVSNGAPRGFALPEMMNVTFSMDDAEIPRAYTTPVRADGTFSVDMNDGSGRGIPYGAYVVAIDTNSLLMKPSGGDARSTVSDGNEYPRPAADVIQKLKKATCKVEVAQAKGLSLVVDLDAGTITQVGSP